MSLLKFQKLITTKYFHFRNMKLNWNTKIIGEKVVLVPYCKKHVPKYHEWMKSEELQHLTGSGNNLLLLLNFSKKIKGKLNSGYTYLKFLSFFCFISEPLSLEQEYEMQENWREDEDKCTFIVLHKDTYNSKQEDEIKSMIGDTNIFIRLSENDDSKKTLIGEAEIMIAEQDYRGQKLGWESMHLMLLYGVKILKIPNFEVKIKMDNKPSISMFEKIGFQETSRSEVFNEVTLIADANQDWVEQYLSKECDNLRLEKYNIKE